MEPQINLVGAHTKKIKKVYNSDSTSLMQWKQNKKKTQQRHGVSSQIWVKLQYL